MIYYVFIKYFLCLGKYLIKCNVIYKLLKFFMDGNAFSGAELGYLFIGCAVAFAVSLFVIKFLMDFVKKHDFKPFGWYRILLGVAVIATLVLPPLLK